MSAVKQEVEDLLVRLDRVLPGRLAGFYLVGSVCLGAFRPGRSDIDFVAILSGESDREELMRLRAVHLGRWASALIGDLALRGRWPLVCNGIYLRDNDLAKSPLDVTPLAGHVAGRFRVAQRTGYDVNPVAWHTLADHGIAVRGTPPQALQIHTDPKELRSWSVANLNDYWRGWAQRRLDTRALPRRAAAAGVLGASRLHYTVATGSIVDKEAAGSYALETFGREWHPLIEDALAFRRGSPPVLSYRRRPIRHRRDVCEFVAAVIDSANQVSLE